MEERESAEFGRENRDVNEVEYSVLNAGGV